MNPESIRKEQQEEGRRMSGTLHPKPDFQPRTERRVEAGSSKPYKPFGDKSPGFTPKKPFKPKGHDAILARIQEGDNDILVMLASGGSFLANVIQRDKYTITVKLLQGYSSECHFIPEGSVVTIYKQHIEMFAEVPAKDQPAEQEPSA